LARRLGHRFADPSLLITAVTHRSWCSEHDGSASNERLEFLGDAVLSVVVAERLYDSATVLPEGQMAKMRARVVSEPVLAEAARSCGLGRALRLGRGEDASGGRDKPSLLSDAYEGVVGAIHRDGGLERARNFILETLGEAIAEAESSPGDHDHKTRLQELAARKTLPTPRYRVEHEGPDHERVYHATVDLGGPIRGRGTGRSKKEAEQAAAAEAVAACTGRPAP
jgi:ribonuclease-3